MTYCIAISLKDGLICASDSRTNAGVDYISVFSKTHRFSVPGEREIFLLNAGNLATTQEVISTLRRDIQREIDGNLLQLESMFDVANKVGETLRKIIAKLPNKRESDVDFSCSFLVCGQIKGEGQRLFRVYNEGNFIESTAETPFFQIGESKYGKPILDRIITFNTNHEDAIKCTLVSFDSTMRSNLSVGLPINLFYLPNNLNDDSQNIAKPYEARLCEGHHELQELRKKWRNGLHQLFLDIPNYDWWK